MTIITRVPPVLTKQDKQTAIDALNAAVENNVPLWKGAVLGQNWHKTGAMCSCAVVAQALGFDLRSVWERGSDGYNARDGVEVYDFLKDRGFDFSIIYHANDKNYKGGFAAAAETISYMEAK